MTLRIGFLGCGGFARRYHVPALTGSAAGRIAIICDSAPNDALREVARQADAPIVATPEALLAPGSCDAVIVSTPHTLHAGHAASVLAAGRHCMVDKPFVMTTAQAESLNAEATRRGLVNAVAFNRRLDRGCLRARELIRNGAIGAVRFVQTVQLGYERGGWFLDPALGGGGPYTGRGTHMADLVPWLIERRPSALRARLRGGSATRADEGGFIELQFDGLECQMTCVTEGWHMWDEIRVFGEDGLIELRRPLQFPIGWELQVQTRRGEARESLAADPLPGAATRDFLAAIAGGGRVACSFADAAVSVRIIEEAFASARGDGGWRRW